MGSRLQAPGSSGRAPGPGEAIGFGLRLATVAVTAVVLGMSAGARQPALTITHAARSLQPGEVVVLEVRAPAGVTEVKATAFGRELPCVETTPGEWRAFAGIDLDVTPGSHLVEVRAAGGPEPLTGSVPLEVLDRAFGTRTLRVAPEFVTPPPSMAARLERERKRVAEALASSAPRPYWTGPFTPPVEGRAVSGFGVRSVFNGQARDPHGGADLAGPTGTPVRAPNAGRVVLAAHHYFPGKLVVLDHGMNVFSMLAHLSRIDVREGADVRRGEVVGLVGATGRVTGPHLHWAVRVAGARVDPFSLIEVSQGLR